MLSSEIELMPGEKIVLASNPHWFYFWKQVLAAAGIIGLLLLLTVFDGTLGDVIWWIIGIAVIVLLIDIGIEFARWKTTRFAVTDQRVAYQTGLLRRRGVSIPLNRINNVNFEQSLLARMLNNGVVTIESAGETGDSVFENIPDPEKVRALIFSEIEADEAADSQRDANALAQAMRDQAPPPPAAGTSPQDRLAQLEQLRAQGMVSDEEFERKRQQILDEL